MGHWSSNPLSCPISFLLLRNRWTWRLSWICLAININLYWISKKVLLTRYIWFDPSYFFTPLFWARIGKSYSRSPRPHCCSTMQYFGTRRIGKGCTCQSHTWNFVDCSKGGIAVLNRKYSSDVLLPFLIPVSTCKTSSSFSSLRSKFPWDQLTLHQSCLVRPCWLGTQLTPISDDLDLDIVYDRVSGKQYSLSIPTGPSKELSKAWSDISLKCWSKCW